MEEAPRSRDYEQSDRHKSIVDFCNGFEEDDDAGGGRGVLGCLAGLVQDHPIGGFKRGGVVCNSHQGGEKFKYDRGIDEVDLLPHGVGDPVRARGRGGGGLGEGEFGLILTEGGSGGVTLETTYAGQGFLRREQVIQKRFVNCDWVRGIGEGRKPGGFPRGDQLFGRPDVV